MNAIAKRLLPKRPQRIPGALGHSSSKLFWTVMAMLAVVAIAVVATFGLFAVAPATGMDPTLVAGDWVVALTYYLFPAPPLERGEVVVFRYPSQPWYSTAQRVVALPGDRLRIVAGQLRINDYPVGEPYKTHRAPGRDPYRDDFPAQPEFRADEHLKRMLSEHVENGEVRVPEGYCFVLGDDRDAAVDSRHWGLLPLENIVARPWLIVFSAGRDESLELPPLVQAPPESEPAGPAKPGRGEDTEAPLLEEAAEEAPEAARPLWRIRWSRLLNRVRPHPFEGVPEPAEALPDASALPNGAEPPPSIR